MPRKRKATPAQDTSIDALLASLPPLDLDTLLRETAVDFDALLASLPPLDIDRMLDDIDKGRLIGQGDQDDAS